LKIYSVMANYITRAGALGQYVCASTQAVPTLSRCLATPVLAAEKAAVLVPGRKRSTPESWARSAPSGTTYLASGIGGRYKYETKTIYK